MIIHKDSHLDHGLSPAHVEFITQRFASKDSFFIETFELPAKLGPLQCALYGPCVGDAAITDDQVTMEIRPGREKPSRLIDLPTRETRTMTVIAGPHDGQPCVLFTAYGGPSSPREPWNVPDEDVAGKEASTAFWAVHALAKDSIKPKE